MNKLPTCKEGLLKLPLNKIRKVKKRHLTLLEVLFAFFIVLMCIFPLVYPHVMIFRQQILYTRQIEMDHAVNLMFGEIYRRLWQKEIPLHDILGGRHYPIDENFLREVELEGKPQFTGEYYFKFEKGKSDQEKTKALYLVELIFDLKLKGDEKRGEEQVEEEKKEQKGKKKKGLHSIAYKLCIYQESPPSGNQEIDIEDEQELEEAVVDE